MGMRREMNWAKSKDSTLKASTANFPQNAPNQCLNPFSNLLMKGPSIEYWWLHYFEKADPRMSILDQIGGGS